MTFQPIALNPALRYSRQLKRYNHEFYLLGERLEVQRHREGEFSIDLLRLESVQVDLEAVEVHHQMWWKLSKDGTSMDDNISQLKFRVKATDEHKGGTWVLIALESLRRLGIAAGIV